MILGSHNSWTYLPLKKWYLKPFRFISKCQDLSIIEQYNLGVRCFDLRIRFNKNLELEVCHGIFKYSINEELLKCDLDVRIIHEARNKKQYTSYSVIEFKRYCFKLLKTYNNIKFWCGRNLYNWTVDFEFYNNPSCEEKYSSVCSPKLIDDWYPRLFAYFNNKKIIKAGTDKEILLIDFVNYGHR